LCPPIGDFCDFVCALFRIANGDCAGTCGYNCG
jgi:hypothetical protein